MAIERPIIDQQILTQLMRDLESFAPKVEARVMRTAMRRGMRLISDAVRASLPNKSGALARSVRLQSRRRGSRIAVNVVVGTSRKRGQKPREGEEDPWYAHLLEFGVGPHIIKPRNAKALKLGANLYLAGEVKHPGFPGRGYLRKAFDANAERTIQEFAKSLERGVERELKRMTSAQRKI